MVFVYELIKFKFTNIVLLKFIYNFFNMKMKIYIINKIQIIVSHLINLFTYLHNLV